MKHSFVNLREELDALYRIYDSFAVYRIVYDEIDRLNQQYYDNFFTFNKDTPLKRLERREQDLIEAFWLRYEFSLLIRKASHSPALPTDDLPLCRALIGANTNQPSEALSNKEDRLYKFNMTDGKDSALHFTFEFSEKNTNLRFARTYFLTNLSQRYMEEYHFSNDEEERKANQNGRNNEMNAKTLLNSYICLLMTYYEVSESFMKHRLTVSEA